MQRHNLMTNKHLSNENEPEDMIDWFMLLPPEIREHIYSFLTNETLINASAANRFLHDSIRKHELPKRGIIYAKKKLQKTDRDFYRSWLAKRNIQNDVDIDLILRVANKIHQENYREKTIVSKVSNTITRASHDQVFMLLSGTALLTYAFMVILVPLIHIIKVLKAENASSEYIRKHPDIERYVNRGYFDLEENIQTRYYQIVLTGGSLILLSLFVLAMNELYNKFAHDPSRLTSQIKKLTSERKSISTSITSFFTQRKETPLTNVDNNENESENHLKR